LSEAGTTHLRFNRLDAEGIASEASETLQSAFKQAAGLQALASLVGLAALTHSVDVSGGLVTAAVLSGGGLVALPVHAARQRRRFRDTVERVALEVRRAMDDRLATEARQVKNTIVDSVAPYGRFVRLEREHCAAARLELSEARRRLKDIKETIRNA